MSAIREVPILEGLLLKLCKSTRNIGVPSIADTIDRLNYFVSTSVFAFFVLMTCAKQYIGSPIKCKSPYEFKSSWDEYVNSFCFVGKLRYIEQLYYEAGLSDDHAFYYYQWVPLLLTLQAFLFYLPNLLWLTIQKHLRVDLCTVLLNARDARSIDENNRKRKIIEVSTYLSNNIHSDSRGYFYHPSVYRFYKKYLQGSTIALLYLFIKFLYAANIIAQCFFLKAIIGRAFVDFGWKTAKKYWITSGEHETSLFPRNAFCDYYDRNNLGNNWHNTTVRCVLSINAFNEKIFVFIWFWLALLAIATFANLIYTLIFVIIPTRRRYYLQCLLKCAYDRGKCPPSNVSIDVFLLDLLQNDGVLIFRWIESHAGAIIAAEICKEMFEKQVGSLLKIHPIIT